MKKLSLFLLLFLISLGIRAQISVKDGSFKEVGQFYTMLEDMTDDNYTPFAVIRVKTEKMTAEQVEKLGFHGDARTFFNIEFHDTEVWVYLTYLATYLKITHPDLSSTEFTIPYDMEPLHGYEILLVNGAVDRNGGGSGSLTLTTVPSEATLKINGMDVGEITPYHNDMMAAGTYEITVSKERYKTTTKSIVLKNGDNQQVEITLAPVCGIIDVTTEPSGATVFVNNKKYGLTPLKISDVQVGDIIIKIEKDDCFPIEMKTVLKDDNTLIINEKLAVAYSAAIKGRFTVDEQGTQVYFSKGNLQYKAKTNTWQFAENQWDYVGSNNKKMSKDYDGWIDYFCWATSGYKYEPYKIQNAFSYERYIRDIRETKFDWGYNAIANGGNTPGIWRSLSGNEWSYIMNKRNTESGMLYALAKVNGVKGLIVLPDDWKASTYVLNYVNEPYDHHYNDNVISKTDWLKKFEANGAVFLPAAGFYKESGKMKIKKVGEAGYYWLGDRKDGSNGKCIYFEDMYVTRVWDSFFSSGFCVRLVRTAGH